MDKTMVLGLIILGGIVLLVFGMFLLPGIGKSGKPVFTVEFDNAKNLQGGDAVYLNGVKIGGVTSVGLDERNKAIAKVLISSKRNIPQDSFFFIWPVQFLTGKKGIHIILGDSSTNISPGARVVGESSYTVIVARISFEKLKELRK